MSDEALELKYSDAVEHLLREGEPFFLVRAQDQFSTEAVAGYAQGLYAGALDRAEHGDHVTSQHLQLKLAEVQRVARAFQEWQESNPDLLKIPD